MQVKDEVRAEQLSIFLEAPVEVGDQLFLTQAKTTDRYRNVAKS